MVNVRFRPAFKDEIETLNDFVPDAGGESFAAIDLAAYAVQAEKNLNSPLYSNNSNRGVQQSLNDFCTKYSGRTWKSLKSVEQYEILSLLCSVTIAYIPNDSTVVGVCVMITSNSLNGLVQNQSVRDACNLLSSYIRLRLIAVKEEYRDQGYGSQLLAYCEKLYKKSGFLNIGGEYSSKKPRLKNFYEKNGYTIVSEENPPKILLKPGLSIGSFFLSPAAALEHGEISFYKEL